jgi:hypothetical protein
MDNRDVNTEYKSLFTGFLLLSEFIMNGALFFRG